MGLEAVSERLEESKKGIEWLVRHSDFSGGVGLRWAKEHLTDLRSLTGYWFGWLDTFSGMPHLPVKLQTAVTWEAYTAGTISFDITSITDTDISFNSGTQRISRTAKGLDVFAVGDRLVVTGSTDGLNDGNYQIATVAGDGSYVTLPGLAAIQEAGPSVTLKICKVEDSASGFDSYDYVDGNSLVITGAGESGNNSTFTIIKTPTNALIYVEEAVTDESETASITIQLTGPSASKTDYVAFAEFGDTGGSVYLYMAKGTEIWRTQGTAWRRVHTLANAQGRQFYVRDKSLWWAAGPSAALQYTEDGTTWQNSTVIEQARIVWSRAGSLNRVLLDEDYMFKRELGSGGWSPTGRYAPLSGSVEPFLIRTTEQWLTIEIDSEVWISIGSRIIRGTTGGSVVLTADKYHSGLLDVTAGCAYQDEMVLVDGGQGPYLWSKDRPLRDISIWRKDGCPPDMKGKIKAVIAVGDAVIAYWELDAGNSLIFWGKPNEAGQWCWHPRSATLTGEFPLGSDNMALAHASLSTKDRRRLWTATADGSTFRLYYQDYPVASWNPLTWTTSQYEAGYLYLFTAWEDLLLMGDQAAALVEIERNAELTATSKLMTVDARTDYDPVAEESASWPISLLTFTNKVRHQFIKAGRGFQALAVQQRIGLNRDSTVTNTPVLYDLGTTVRRQVRHVGLRRK